MYVCFCVCMCVWICVQNQKILRSIFFAFLFLECFAFEAPNFLSIFVSTSFDFYWFHGIVEGNRRHRNNLRVRGTTLSLCPSTNNPLRKLVTSLQLDSPARNSLWTRPEIKTYSSLFCFYLHPFCSLFFSFFFTHFIDFFLDCTHPRDWADVVCNGYQRRSSQILSAHFASSVPRIHLTETRRAGNK